MGSKVTASEMYYGVFNTSAGRWVLNDILERGGVGGKIWANEQFLQNMNVARHDFATEIKELVEKGEGQ